MAEASGAKPEGRRIVPSRIALIGYRCTGKTSVARLLGELLSMPWIDLDREIQTASGVTIAETVAREGWPGFRQRELRALEACSSRERVVAAMGGGVVVTPHCRELLSNRFYTVWLTARVETIFKRMRTDPVTGEQRPALTELDPEREIRALLDERAPWYRACARMVVATDEKSPRELAAEIRSRLTGKE